MLYSQTFNYKQITEKSQKTAQLSPFYDIYKLIYLCEIISSTIWQ